MANATEPGFGDLLGHNRILCQFRADSKTVLLKRLASLLRNAPCVQEPEGDIIDQFVRRERLGSTVIHAENQVALPHVRLPGVSAPSAALIVMARSVSFDDEDRPARIVLGLALPQSISGSRQPLIDEICQFFSVAGNCAAIRSAQSPQDAMRLIRELSSGHTMQTG